MFSQGQKTATSQKHVFTKLRNPCRMLQAQEPYVRFISKARYAALQRRVSGFVMLKDKRPTEPELLADTDPAKPTEAPPTSAKEAKETAAAITAPAPEEKKEEKKDDEQTPPEPFEFS